MDSHHHKDHEGANGGVPFTVLEKGADSIHINIVAPFLCWLLYQQTQNPKMVKCTTGLPRGLGLGVWGVRNWDLGLGVEGLVMTGLIRVKGLRVLVTVSGNP